MKKYLMTPGPTEVPPETLLATAKPVFHHRTPQFMAVLKEATELLKYVLQTTSDVFVISGSGTAAMEACIANILRPGDKAICVRGGKFGERWTKLCEAFGGKPINVDVEWGTAVNPDLIAGLLRKEPNVRAVCITLCETSTAVATDIEAIGNLTRNTDTLLIVDGVSGVGAMVFKMDEWGVDMVAVGSQKALMMPPGLAIVGASAKAMRAVEATKTPTFYLSLKAAKKAAGATDTPYTPAVTLVVGLVDSLRQIRAEGIENVWKRHARLAAAFRAGVNALGLELLSKSPADSVTAVLVPEGIDGEALVKNIEKKYGVKFAGGQDQLKGRIVRVSTMGYCDRFDVVIALSALEMALTEAGAKVPLGAGVRAAEEVFLAG